MLCSAGDFCIHIINLAPVWITMATIADRYRLNPKLSIHTLKCRHWQGKFQRTRTVTMARLLARSDVDGWLSGSWHFFALGHHFYYQTLIDSIPPRSLQECWLTQEFRNTRMPQSLLQDRSKHRHCASVHFWRYLSKPRRRAQLQLSTHN